MGHSYGSLEGKNTEKNPGSTGPAHAVSKGKKNSTRNQAKDHWSCVLAKNLASYDMCPENWSDAQFKSDGRICLVEELWMGVFGLCHCHCLAKPTVRATGGAKR